MNSFVCSFFGRIVGLKNIFWKRTKSKKDCFPSKSWDSPYLCFIIQTDQSILVICTIEKIVNFTISKRKPSTLWPLCVLPLVDLPAQNCLSPYLPVLRDWMPVDCYVRYHSRFFVPVGHESTHATIGNTVFPRIVSAETILFLIWPYVLWPLVTVHKSAETIQGRKLFAEIR